MRPHLATEKDWPDVEALLHASCLSTEGIHEHIAQYFIIRDNAGLLGCAGVERYDAMGVLRALAVAQRARSAGLGELLISAVVADGRKQGVESIVLQTKTASGYFARLGFTSTDLACLPPSVRRSSEFNHHEDDIGTLMQICL